MSEPPPQPPGPRTCRGAWDAARLVPEAVRLLRRTRRLWPLAAAPVVLTALGALAVVTGVTHWSAELHHAVAGWLPNVEAGAWYTWLWVGPLRALLAVAGGLLFALAVGILLAIAFAVANVLSAPLLDALSEQVEQIESGRVASPGDGGLAGLWRGGWRAISNEARRLAFFALLWLGIVAFGVVVPGAQAIAPALLTGLTILLLPLDYGGPALDRRNVPFRTRRAWLRRHWRSMSGFGGAAFTTFLVPGLNFLALPVLVTAGTLLALRCPLPEGVSPTGRAARAGSSTSP